MQVGLLTDVYLPVLNGVTNFVVLHKQMLEKLGHEPWVFAPGHPEQSDLDARIVRYRALPLASTGYYLGISAGREARTFLRTMDILHVQHPAVSGAVAVRERRRWGTPVVFTSHTRYDLYAQHYLPVVPELVTRSFIETFLPTFTNQVDMVITPSASVREVVREWGVKVRIEVVPNGVDVEAIRHPARLLTRSDVGLPDDALVAVFVGRMASEKSVDRLLRAFAGVAQTLANAWLILVGSGPSLQDYQMLAQEMGVADRTLFAGRVPYELVPSYLHMGDLFVTASTTEVHPLTVLEAIAAGLPVVGIRSPGIADTIEPEVNGLLTANDYVALAAAMTRAMVDTELRRRLSEGAARSANDYDIYRTTRQLVELYKDVISQRTFRET